jgi:hypothetical protein
LRLWPPLAAVKGFPGFLMRRCEALASAALMQPQTGRNTMNASNITPGHVRAFQAVTTSMYGEPVLWSCQINSEPGVAIVLM